MLSEEHGVVKHLSRTATVVAVVAWLIVSGYPVMWTIWYGKDLASAILDVLALLIGAVGAYCLGRAVDARRERVGLLWAGRALGLFGAAVAVAFPTILYGEIVMLAERGQAPTYDIEAAIWHEFWVMPLTLVPALVALRWGRIGGLLFLLLAAYNIADGVFHLGGVNYFPEARTDLAAYVMSNGPAVLTAALLLIGSVGWRGEEGGTFVSRPVAAAR
jgi:hypothetical protein